MLLKVLDVRSEAKRFISTLNLNEIKGKRKDQIHLHVRFKGFT